MITLEEINYEVDEFNKYMGTQIPYFSDLKFEDTYVHNAKIKKEDIFNNNFTLYIGKPFETNDLKSKKAILWHEFTHVMDILDLKEKYDSDRLSGIISTYSEAHAESIKARKLLNINLNKQLKLGEAKRKRIYLSGGQSSILSQYEKFYIKSSVKGLELFFASSVPDANLFDIFLNNFCYFCGFLKLHNKIEADKMILDVINEYPKELIPTLKDLYKAIMSNDFERCSELYDNLFSLFRNRYDILIKNLNGNKS